MYRNGVILMLGVWLMFQLVSCSNDEELVKGPTEPCKGKTVLVYMAAGSPDLSEYCLDDLREIKDGSCHISDEDNLLVFVRQYDDTDLHSIPWLARIKNGEVIDSISVADMGIDSNRGEYHASDSVLMDGVLRYAFTRYLSREGLYGLVLWGHSNGWLIKGNRTRAFGLDRGKTGDSWIDIPTVAAILNTLPHLEFIIADCCNFMCLENIYELRNCCDYIIGSPAEIPLKGAPYDVVVPDLFGSDNFYQFIVEKYSKSTGDNLPLAVARTSGMENLAHITCETIKALNDNICWNDISLTGLIHYGSSDEKWKYMPEYNQFFDAGDFFRAYAPDNIYLQWYQALSEVIVWKHFSAKWTTQKPWDYFYSDFRATPERMHGVSMFLPHPSLNNTDGYFQDLQRFEWYKTVWQENKYIM